MSFEERIAPTSAPELVAEHEARYRFARPVIRAAGTWCDLSCGTAAGSSRAMEGELPPRVVLTDIDREALAGATDRMARSCGGTAPGLESFVVDLTSGTELDALCRRLEEGPLPLVLTCFEVIEHLPTFVPLVTTLLELGRRGATVVLSAPNDAFSGVANPFHVTTWGSSSVAELRQMLPADHVIAAQVSLEGTAITRPGHPLAAPLLPPDDQREVPPLAYLLAWGPAADSLGSCSVAAVGDTLGHRVWESQRDVDNQYFRTAAAQTERLSARVAELEAELARRDGLR